MNYNDKLNELKSKLQYIQETLTKDSFKEPMLSVVLNELIEEIKELEFKYDVPVAFDNQHSVVFTSYGSKYKSKLLADLNELQHEMNKKSPSEKRCQALIQKMIRTDFYTLYLQKKLDVWINTTNITLQTKQIFV